MLISSQMKEGDAVNARAFVGVFEATDRHRVRR